MNNRRPTILSRGLCQGRGSVPRAGERASPVVIEGATQHPGSEDVTRCFFFTYVLIQPKHKWPTKMIPVSFAGSPAVGIHQRVCWLLLAIVLVAAAPCPPDGPVTADTYAVGCANLHLTVAADNVTLVIKSATGIINVSSDAAGTSVWLLDSTVAGNITLRGSHAFADIRGSNVSGDEVVVLSGVRNVTIVVVDSTLKGAVVASVLSSAVGVSIAIANSTLNATRYAASIVGGMIRGAEVVVAASRLALVGGDNVGVVALAAATVANTTVNVSASSITCRAGNFVAILGTSSGDVSWTNVSVSAAVVNVTSIARQFVAVLGASSSNRVTWARVIVTALFANVESTAAGGYEGFGGSYVGVIGAIGYGGMVSWTDVAVSAAFANVTSAAGEIAGVLGAGSGSGVSWTNVNVSTAFANVRTTATNAVGVLGAGCNSGVTWTYVYVSAACSNVRSTAADRVGVLGAGSWPFVRWTNVTVSAAFANVRSNTSGKAGILGAMSNSGGGTVANVTFTNVSEVCRNNTVEAEYPDHVAALVDRARRLHFCGWVCATETATESRTQTDSRTSTATETETSTATSQTLTAMGTDTATSTSKTATATGTETAKATDVTSPTQALMANTTIATVAIDRATAAARATATTTKSTPTTTATATSAYPDAPPQQQQHVEAAAAVAAAALGVFFSPLATSKGTTLSRVLAGRECHWAPPEPEPTQFVFVFEAGGSSAAGALTSTLLLQVVVAFAAAAAARVRCWPHVSFLHIAALSYYGPNVVALATAVLSSGGGGFVAAASLVLNTALMGVASGSAWGLATHHRALWMDARNPRSGLVRIYGGVDLACAFAVGALSGAGGLACATRGALTCAACLVNFAYAVLVRPVVTRLDNALGATTSLLLFGLALLSAAAPRTPNYDTAVLALAAAVAAWMYLLLVLAMVTSVRRALRHRAANPPHP